MNESLKKIESTAGYLIKVRKVGTKEKTIDFLGALVVLILLSPVILIIRVDGS